MQRTTRALIGAAVLLTVLVGLAPEVGADGFMTLHKTEAGCEVVHDYGVGLQGSGTGTIAVDAGPGPVVAAFVEWAGYDDPTPNDIAPGGSRADSTLTINGVEVVGTQPPGEVGYAPSGLPQPWYSWYADVGPTGLGIITSSDAQTVDVSGYDTNVGRYNNGLSLVIVYDTSPCPVPSFVEVRTGIDYYWRGLPDGQGITAPIIYNFAPADFERQATFFINHAGTDSLQTVCRGDAIWMSAGSGDHPDSIVAIDAGTGAAYGINGGVEALDDPFGDDLPCTTEINPAPDFPYEAGHPYPGGAQEAPFKVLNFHRDFQPEWTSMRFDVLVPAGATWFMFQMESEADQVGESGASVGGGPFVLTPSGDVDATPRIDVSLVKNVSTSASGPFGDELVVDVGDTVFWEIIVSAASQDADGNDLDDVTGLVVDDVAPGGITIVDATGDGSFDTTTGVWTIGDLAAGDSVRLVLESTVDAVGRHINLAEVADHVESDIDSTPGNGPQQPPEDDDDSAAVSASLIDVELTKQVDGVDGPVDRVPGNTITYSLTVEAKASGPNGEVLSDVTGLTVADTLPDAVTYVSSTGDGSYDPATGTWTIGDLAAGSSASIDLVVTIDADAPVEFDNFAQVDTHDQPDIDSTPGNGPQQPSEDDEDVVTVKLPSVSPTTDVNTTTTTVSTTTAQPGGDVGGDDELPNTGADSLHLGWMGLLVLVLGVDLVILATSIDKLGRRRVR
ncbi:MAG: DUF11 domain-containing protein [Acidimicrobiales bacterium]|nr:DUF11 domain-containing protein [Acidimicrobiales bacterium]